MYTHTLSSKFYSKYQKNTAIFVHPVTKSNTISLLGLLQEFSIVNPDPQVECEMALIVRCYVYLTVCEELWLLLRSDTQFNIQHTLHRAPFYKRLIY